MIEDDDTTDQPSNRPWQLVLDYVQSTYPMDEPIAQLVVTDLQEVAREEVLLSVHENGCLRNAYRAQLEMIAYLRAWLDAKAVDLDFSNGPPEDQDDQAALILFANQVSQLPMLRALIETATTIQ